MVSSVNNPDQLVLQSEHVHLIYGLLAAISLTNKTEKQLQAMHDIASDLGTTLASLQPTWPHEAQLKTGAEILEWRVEEIDRKELRNELRTTLNAINKASRDLIITHRSLEEYKVDMAMTTTRKRKREQFDELEQKFSDLEQIRLKLKLSIPGENDEQAEQHLREPATTPKPKVEPTGSDCVPPPVLPTLGNSAVPEGPSIATKPSFPGPSCTPEAARVSMPAPSSSSDENVLQDLIAPRGPKALSTARRGGRKYSYAYRDSIYKCVARLPSPSEEGEPYNTSAERGGHGEGDGSAPGPSRDPRLRLGAIQMRSGHGHHG